jgi:hypothetical protein
MASPKKKFGGGKIIATILGLVLLVGGVGAGVVLTQQQQLFQPKAAGSCTCDVNADPSGYATYSGTCVGATCQCNAGDSVISNSCTTTPTAAPTAAPTVAPTAAPTVTPSCAGDGACKNGRSCCSGLVEQYDSSCTSGSNPPFKCVATTTTCAEAGACKNGRSCCSGLTEQFDSTCASGSNAPYKCMAANTQCTQTNCNGTACTGGKTCTGSPGSCTCTGGGSCTADTGCSGHSTTSAKCVIGTGVTGCTINHYWCKGSQTYSNGCSDILVRSKIGGTESISENCGTEQIDISCPVCSLTSRDATNGSLQTYASYKHPDGCDTSGEPDYVCNSVKVYDTNWNPLTQAQLSALTAGTTIRLAISGTASVGVIDKAKFTVNGVERAEVTQKKPGGSEFYDEYVIPAGVTSFTISAKLHHDTFGWF